MKKVLFTATVDSHILQFHLPFLKLFKDKGYEVHVATNGKEEIPYCDKKYVIPFERSPFKINNLKAIRKLKKVIENEHYDIIHTHTPMGGVVTRLAAKKSRKNGTRVIYTAHGFHFYNGAPLINWMLFYPVEKCLSKYTDTLITINKEDYDLAKRKFKKCKDIRYVPGVGIDEEKFNFSMSEQEKLNFRRELGLKKDDFVMIYPARLDKNKNQGFLIEVMEKLVKDYNNIHLLLPGLDELNGYYQKLVKEKGLEEYIHFLGYRKDIPKLLKISDLAVSSSLREGLGLNLVEAVYVGLPIMAKRNRGHNEIVTSTNGFLFENVEDFLIKVKKIIKNRNLVGDRSSAEKFLLKNIIEKMKLIYFIDERKKLLFVHTEEKVKIDSNNNMYTDGCYDSKIWDRYLNISLFLTTIFRKDDKIYNPDVAKNNFNILPKNITTVFVYNRKKNLKSYLSPIVLYKNKGIIKNEVLKADGVIVRVPCDDSYTAFKYAHKYNKPVIVEVVGCPLDTLWHLGIKGKILAFPSYLKMKRCIKKAEKVIYVTNSFLQRRYPNKNYNIGCSDVELVKSLPSILNGRIKRITNLKKEIVIGTIGNVDNKYKGQKDVIEAISILQKKGYNINYRMVGNGDPSYLNSYALKKNVKSIEFVGSIPHSKINDFLDSIDIYIHPSYTEGLCRSIVEAISRACPTIVSNAGGNAELVDSKYVYGKGNIKELVKKIELLIKSEEMKEQAEINFLKASSYDFEKLKNMRDEFYSILFNEERPIRVLHVVNRMGIGGIETFIMNVYRKIDRNKIQFDFAVHSNIPGDYDEEIKKMGGNIYYFSQRRDSFIKYLSSWKKFLKCNAFKYSAIHMHVSSLTTIAPIVYAKKFGIPTRILHSHSTNEIGFLHKITCYFNKKRFLKYANKCFACSKIAGGYTFGTECYTVISNGIDIEKYKFNNNVRKKIRNELGVNDNTKCYIHVGRFCYAKNHEFLIDIFDEIVKNNPNSILFLIGDGELKQNIVDKIKKLKLNDHIILLGKKYNVNEYLMAMDAFIFPSHYEGLPISIVESQAANLITFLSDTITEEVKLSNYIFFLSLSKTAKEWAGKIANTNVEEKTLYDDIKKFDVNYTINELINVYRR